MRCAARTTLGFDAAAGGDEVCRALVLARIIEPTSKLDWRRVLAEVGVEAPSYRMLRRHLPDYAKDAHRCALAAACAAHVGVGPASLLLYDVTTLYFEIDSGDGFREPGFSKKRRLDPQITVGLLTDAAGFPLTVQAFEGNKAETKTMIPVLKSFMTSHQLAEVTVVADAGMFSEANQHDIEDTGLSVILAKPNPRDPVSPRPMAPRASRRTDPARTRVHPTVAGHDSAEVPGPAGQDHLLPVPGRQSSAHPARDR
jgi:Transposase DDE domain